MTFHVLDHHGQRVASGATQDQAITKACASTMNSWDSLHRAGWSVSTETRLPLLGWLIPLVVIGALGLLAWGVWG